MTPQQRKLNELIMLQVLHSEQHSSFPHLWLDGFKEGLSRPFIVLPNFAGDRRTAVMLLEWLGKQGVVIDVSATSEAEFCMAVCEAALNATKKLDTSK